MTSWKEPQSWRSASSPVWAQKTGSSVHGVQPDRDPLLHVVDVAVDERRSAEEERQAGGRERRAPGGDVEHGEEDPEQEQRAAEVVRLDEHEHRRAPDQEQRAEVLQPALGQHLALLAQVAGEEDDQEDLRQLAGLELEGADPHPEPRAVDRLADHRQCGQHHQRDRGDSEEVLVGLEHAVVAPERDQRQREEADAADDPEALAEGVVRVEPVDHGDADRREQRGERQQHRVGPRNDARATRCATR